MLSYISCRHYVTYAAVVHETLVICKQTTLD